MRQDRQRHRAQVSSSARHLSKSPASPIGEQLAQIRHLGRAIMDRVSPDQTQELKQLLDQAEEMAAYEAMHDEIEAASQTLETHRPEFEAMMSNLQAAADRARHLFSEERFVPWRFTAAELHRAFEAVGYPQRFSGGAEESVDTAVAAILHLADKEHRHYLARQLMLLLPEYVAAERYLDAWLIQYSAFQMIEAPDESNPFLAEMFYHGFEDWATRVDTQQETLLHEMGFDPSTAAEMSIEEAEARIRAQMADPAKKARLEAYYADHPMLGDQAQAEMWALERGAFDLLERDDADALYLSPEEVNPWLPTLLERLAPFEAQAQQADERGEFDASEVLKPMQEVFLDIAREMVPAVFTSERLAQLTADLRTYRNGLREAGESEAAMYAHAALMMLEQEEPPVENSLLTFICFASLRLMMITMAEKARAKAGGGAETEE